MKRAGVLPLVLFLALVGGCRQGAAPGTDPPPGAPPTNLTQGPGQYQFTAASSFAVSLGQPPQVAAQVAPYTVSPGLANVANLSLFKDNLRPEHLKQIAAQGFVVVPADWKQMEFVYELNNYPDEHRPTFVTTDSMLHTFHVFYDYLLRTMEVTTLYNRLTALAQGLLQETAKQYRAAQDAPLKEAAACNFAYALVPVRLLGLSPSSEVGTVPDEVQTLAKKELALIEAHQDIDASGLSPTVGFKVDYSQFIPRGHYTRSEKLKQYFKAMMWYGLMPVALRNMRKDLAPRQARQAVLLAQDILYGKLGTEALGKIWNDIYEPTAFMVGVADDNTPADYGKVMYKLFGEPLDTRKLIPEENLTQLADQVLALRKPGIEMASITQDPEKPGIPQFRLMGQRYILDSYLFQNMVFPFVGKGQQSPNEQPGSFNKRTFPMGLDVMSLLGSQRAYDIADKTYEQTKFLHYDDQTQKLRAEVAAYTEADWTKTIYAGWLHTLKLLLEVKGQGYPSFMQNPAWTDKQLNAALGSWAELRHDTILYAKQSVVAECGGGPEEEEPHPKGYVEPEALVYWRLGLLATQLRDGLKARDLLKDESVQEAFGELISLLQFLQGVSVKELANQPLTQEEYDTIEYYGDKLSSLNMYTKRGGAGDEITSMTDKDMAVIADVHTGVIGNDYMALEEGVGHANEVYAVYPLNGKLMLGRGAVFSYYEFTQPVADRMTDEMWQAKLGSKQRPQPPKWTASFLSPKSGTGEEVQFQSAPSFTGGGC